MTPVTTLTDTNPPKLRTLGSPAGIWFNARSKPKLFQITLRGLIEISRPFHVDSNLLQSVPLPTISGSQNVPAI
ncbi:hypothetical protein N7468_000524 [Penicillium chermesinum]|uniref:Uncharacterized protein n=1 Tax=Penicillium chermesinum TaxID=63820 RepID=A0A9W9PKE0_9EURO|nr:uncharacterized protein N7468_000524 [Penicillium chermesinum]KAJ5249073.1 hypothetical protein N7468_000524 [Penicillium chermesinum]